MIRSKIYEKAIKHNKEPAVFYDGKTYLYSDLLKTAAETSWLTGKIVAIVAPKSFEFVSLVFSSFINQFTFVPLSLNHPESRNIEILNDVKPDLIIGLNEGKIGDHEITPYQHILKNESVDITQNELAYIIYTSGSTGKPKGVMVGRQGLYNIISQQVRTFGLNKSRFFFYVNTVFDASISDMLCSFLSGSCLYINEAVKTQFKRFQEFINKNEIEYIDLPPSVLQYLDINSLPHLKTLIVGGEIPDFKAIQKATEKINIFNVYGPTECSICTSVHKCDQDFNQPFIGKPFDNVEYKIIDDELYIAGSCLAFGYTDEKMTKERFIFIDGKRFYKTGDKVKSINGNYLFLGREDSQIKHRGQLVNLEEVSMAAKSVPGVLDAFCFYDQDILLFIEGEEQELIPMLKNKIPSYMIPKRIFFHKRFKRNSSNKIDKNAILSQYDFYLAKKAKEMDLKPQAGVLSATGEKTILTGSTGLLGVHLLAELTKTEDILCLVRAKSEKEGLERIKNKAESYQLKVNWARVKVVLGDCSLDNLGLDSSYLESVGRVIHCAAEVNNLKSHQELYLGNVQSTINIVKFCQNKTLKRLEYISTLSVFVCSDYKTNKTFSENSLTVEYRKLNNGYASTKWQAEFIVESAKQNNPNMSIYRLGLLTESTSKDWMLNKSFLFLTFKEIQKLNKIPKLDRTYYIDLSPVNLVSEDLVKIFNKKQSDIYNVSYNVKLSFDEMMSNHEIEIVDLKEWFKESKTKIISRLCSIMNPEPGTDHKMNIFETTFVDKFQNDNFLRDSERKEINQEQIKQHYFKIWKVYE